MGSSCIYPEFAKQPIKETELLGGKLERTNEPYAIAKISGIKLCESYNRQYGTDYRCLMPTNLYGPNDNYNDKDSHVIPALINRLHMAKVNNLKEVKIWGSGNPKEEFLHVDDLASASIRVMKMSKIKFQKLLNGNSHVNIGTGVDISIKKLVYELNDIIKFNGKIVFDKSKPDGTKEKLLNIDIIKSTNWYPSYNLSDGLKVHTIVI